MEVYEFPMVYREKYIDNNVTVNRRIDEQNKQEKILQIEQEYKEKIQNLSNKRNSLSSNMNWSEKIIEGITFISMFIALIRCTNILFDDLTRIKSYVDSIKSFFGIIFIGVIIGCVIGGIYENSIEKRVKKIDNDIEDEEEKCKYEINRIKNGSDSDAKKREMEADLEYKKYYAEFEKHAQRVSVKYAGSQLAGSIVDWMTDGFIRMIETADRSESIATINDVFSFEVYKNRIICDLGNFDFYRQRCKELPTPLDQAGLARAIASAVQVNIAMKYPKDLSGTKPSINISTGYSKTTASIRIIYSASNGYYVEERSW